MLYIPTVVWQPPELGQLGMSGNCFSAENHISLVQASQRQYIYGYDSQTSSEFEHNCKIDQLIYTNNLMNVKHTEEC
jgi:hypothetical protein